MTPLALRAAALAAALVLSAGPALAQPDIAASPNPLDLGDVSVPGGENPVVVVQNVGTAPLVLTGATVAGSDGDDFVFGEAFSDDVSFPLTLAPTESVDLTLVVTPARGRQNGTLTVQSNDPDQPTLVVPITFFGTFVEFDVAPDAIDFGPVFVRLDANGEPIAPPTVCRPLAISAEGDESGAADQFEIRGSGPGRFTVDGEGDLSSFEVFIAANDTTVVDVCFTPSGEGTVSAVLEFVAVSLVNGNNGVGFAVPLAAEATTTNLPPVPIGIADGDVFEVVVDSPRTIAFAFASPEAGQTTTVDVTEVGGDELSFFATTTPGNPATAEVEVSVFNGTGGAPTGTYDLQIEACDDATDGAGADVSACTTLTVTVDVDYPPTQACDFGVQFYINEFVAGPDENYVQLYSTESGLVDLTGCSLVAFDGITEQVVVAQPLTFSLFPFGEPNLVAGVDFAGALPTGPGAIAIVKGTPAVGDDVLTVEGDVVNAIVYRTDDDVFGICGEGTLIGGAIPAAPCDSEAGRSALAAALAQLGTAVSAEDGAEVDLSVATAPNPTAAAATVSFGLAAAGDVRVALFDALGRRVAVVAERAYGAGRHAEALDVSALPAGVYVVRVVAPDGARTARLTVAR